MISAVNLKHAIVLCPAGQRRGDMVRVLLEGPPRAGRCLVLAPLLASERGFLKFNR